MYWNINQLDFACLAAGVPLACLPSRARSFEVGDIPPAPNPDSPQFPPHELSIALLINISGMLAQRNMSLTEFADRLGITLAHISILSSGQAIAIRLSTLAAICQALNCQPGDILEYK